MLDLNDSMESNVTFFTTKEILLSAQQIYESML